MTHYRAGYKDLVYWGSVVEDVHAIHTADAGGVAIVIISHQR